jgi:hypothetical protein
LIQVYNHSFGTNKITALFDFKTFIMTDEKQTGLIEENTTMVVESKEKEVAKGKKVSPLETDSKTLQTTDPEENMEGPISSIMQTIKEGGEANDVVSKEEADRKKDENT